MKITAIHQKTVPISSAIRNAFIDFSKMTASIVAVVSDVYRNGKPVVGYGFNSNGRYAPEGILKSRMIPRILDAAPTALCRDDGENFSPHKIWQIMMSNEKPGGHGERTVAVGILDMALWDLVAKIANQPLYRLISEQFNLGRVREEVFVYAAGGYYYPGKGIRQLQDEMKSYLDLGYETLKMKIGGTAFAEDMARIEAVLALLPSTKSLAVDANGRFKLKEALRYGRALNDYNLRWYEEPGDPLDFELNKEVCRLSTIPIATGENLFSWQDAQNLIRYGGMYPDRDLLQFDPALSYGLVEYLRTRTMLEQNGWSAKQCIPHGGHQFALHIAAGLELGGNESYPHVFQPFGGFADDTPVINGKIKMPSDPGIGIENKKALFKVFRTLF